jgi:long-chain acyl-CoA synthetase
MDSSIYSQKPWYKHYPARVRHNICYPKESIAALIEQTGAMLSRKPAIIFNDREISYSELIRKASKFSTALITMGVGKDDVIGIMMQNCPEYAISVLGALRIGAIVVPVNPVCPEKEAQYMLNHTSAKVLIIQDSIFQKYPKIQKDTSITDLVVASYSNPVQEDNQLYWSFDELLRKWGPTSRCNLHPGDVAFYLFTGGTTGIPKAAIITHENVVSSIYIQREWRHVIDFGKETLMAFLPWSHTSGLVCNLLMTLVCGWTCIALPKFDLQQVLENTAKYKVTLFNGNPTIYTAMLNHKDIGKLNYLSSLKLMTSGGAPLPIEIHQEIKSITGKIIMETYGLTEASPSVSANPPMIRSQDIIEGSCGLIYPGIDVKIVDPKEGKKEVPLNEPGELICRGPNIMKGYYKMPAETRKTIKEGWLYTGDIALMDSEGWLFIVDRKKEIILSGGYNVYPRQVEEVLYKHPSIREAAVIGVPNEYFGESVKAYVSLKPEMDADPEEIIKFCRVYLAGYKAPHQVQILDDLPKTENGKILKRLIREQYESKSGD